MTDPIDPHLAAYAKGLEAAAAECDEVAGENHWAFAPERHELVEVAAARIRALSPLPPGTRVVVVPPEGSGAWTYATDAAFAALPPDAHGTIGVGEMERVLRAALRALTGGDDRE